MAIRAEKVVNVENSGCKRSAENAGNDGYFVSKSDEERRRSTSDDGVEIVGVSDKEKSYSESESSVEVGLENGMPEIKVHLAKVKTDCRICHLSMDAADPDHGVPIELGCSCKDDLAAAHEQCADAWFKIKGNTTCEICGCIARNVTGANEIELTEQLSEFDDTAVAADTTHAHNAELRNFWHSHRFLNFLLASMVFAFVISWLFHFNVPS